MKKLYIISLLFTYLSTCYSQVDTIANLDINNVRALYWSFGSMFWDLEGTPKYEVPINSGKTSIFANGLWVGGLDDSNQLHFAGEMYRGMGADFFNGPIMDDVYYVSEEANWKKIWKISKADIVYHSIHYNDANYIIPQEIAEWPGNGDTTKGQQLFLAPYKDVNSNTIYDPQNGDYPLILGDQAVFFIVNDSKESPASGGLSVGIEVHGMAYAFNVPSSDAFYNTTFLKYKIFNRSNNNYHDVYIGNFTDIDIGDPYDDFIGCDVQRSSYFGYNGDAFDGEGQAIAYGANPPAQSVTFLGSLMPSDGIDNPANIDFGINGYGFGDGIIDNERYGLCRFAYFNNGNMSYNTKITDPSFAEDYYNYLRGYWKDGTPMTYGGIGYNLGSDLVSRFMFPGDSDPLHWGTNYQTPLLNPNDWKEDTTMQCLYYFRNYPDTLIVSGETVITMLDTFYFSNPDTIIITSDSIFSVYQQYVPDDRRGLGSVGPITLESGQMQEYDIAFVWSQDLSKSINNSTEKLKSDIDTIRKYFVLGKTPDGQSFETNVAYQTYNKSDLFIYPNPAKDKVIISNIQPSIQSKQISIYNLSGQKIKDFQLEKNSKNAILNLETLSNGLYIIKLGEQVKKIAISR